MLDRLARDWLGLADGYEGNAQNYRIIASLYVIHGSSSGLNLTAATRSAVAKYPWLPCLELPGQEGEPVPPGLRWIEGELRVRKYSAYFLDAADLQVARSAAHGVLPLQQSFEASVMDIADDIAYSVHDIEDFHRAGLLGDGAVGREFKEWLENWPELRTLTGDELMSRRPPAGSSLELLRRKTVRDDPWVADPDAFWEAVRNVSRDLVDGMLAEGFDGSFRAERAVAAFTRHWIHHLRESVVLAPPDNPRTGLVTLDQLAWHEVEVLKFIHKHFVLDRADIGMYQRGLGRVLVRAVKAWWPGLRTAGTGAGRQPLRELIELATEQYLRLAGPARRCAGDRPARGAAAQARSGRAGLCGVVHRRAGDGSLGSHRRAARPVVGDRAHFVARPLSGPGRSCRLRRLRCRSRSGTAPAS